MEKRLSEPSTVTKVDPAASQRAIAAVLSRPHPLAIAGQHTPPPNFDPGKPLELSASFGARRGLKGEFALPSRRSLAALAKRRDGGARQPPSSQSLPAIRKRRIHCSAISRSTIPAAAASIRGSTR